MTDKKLTVREARAALAADDEERKRAVVEELEAIGSGEITDVLSWDELGRVQVRPSDKLSTRAKRSIKKVKITPNEHGNTIEVEMHDKIAALRLLSKHHGLMETGADENRPTIIGINLKGPAVTHYETKVIDAETEETTDAE